MPDAQAGAGIEFRLLGPVEVVFDQERVFITAARQEIALTMLLLEAGHIVSVDLLIDAIWGDSPPTTAKSQVQICVSQLRKMLAGWSDAIMLLTRPAGYVLEIPEGSLDLQRFRSLTARAVAIADCEPAVAVSLYRAALDIWRGDACAGVESQIVAQAATRLNESRRTALGDCIDLELRTGGHNKVIGELSELVAQQPLWERPRKQLMVALYRSGRQAEALRVYQAAREIMLEDLGLEPSKEMRTLQQSILVGDPVLDLPGGQPVDGRPDEFGETASQQTVTPQLLPATIADFAGRGDDLALISTALTGQEPADAARPGGIHVPIVVLTGRGGAGKTTLALRAAHLLSDRFPDGQLYAKLREGIEPVTSTSTVLDRFLRAFGVRSSSLPDTLEERAEMYRSLLAGKRLLVVLDDATSVSQVEPLLPGHPGCAVIITCRTRAARPAGAACLEVGALDSAAGATLLAQVIGIDRVGAEPEAVATMVELCEGLPLALRIAAAKLAARPHWRIERLTTRLANERRRLDELVLEKTSIRAMLDLTCQNLTAEQQRLLRRLSLLAPNDFPCWVGAPLLETDVIGAEELLEELVINGLVEAWNTPEGETRYQLHDLVRLYAAEALAAADGAAERQAFVARYIGCLLSLTSEAHRRYYGGAFYVPRGSARQYPLPADTVNSLLANPIIWLRTERTLIVGAIMLAARVGLDELCWELAVTAVTLFEAEPYPEDWRGAHQAALIATREAGNQRGTAALLFSLGMLATTRKLDEAADLLRQSCHLWEELDDTHGLALALHGLAGIERLCGQYESATARYRRALTSFDHIGDHAGQAAVLRCLGQIEMNQQHLAVAEDLFGQAINTAERAGSRRDMTQAKFHLAELWLQRGSLKTAERLFQTVCAETKAGADTVGQGYGFLGLGITYIMSGDAGRAADNLRAALALAGQTDDMLLRGRVLLASAEFDAASGRYGSALEHLDRALATFNDYGSAAVWQGRVIELASRVRLQLSDTAPTDPAA